MDREDAPLPGPLAACIDIGSNTTRLLVAEAPAGRLRAVALDRRFTAVAEAASAHGAIPPAKLEEVAKAVADQAAVARQLGARRIRAVATAAIRRAPNWAELVAAVKEACGVAVTVLSEEEEARLAFAGAVRDLEQVPAGDVAVVDVGGGSTEVAVGRPGEGMSWCRSLPLGSGVLTREHARADPPRQRELDAMRGAVDAAFARLHAPEVACVFAVGGSATSLWALAGESLDGDALARALEAVTAAPAKAVAERLALDARRVRLLPAGILILAGATGRLGAPMSIGRGGLREGVVLEELNGGD